MKKVFILCFLLISFLSFMISCTTIPDSTGTGTGKVIISFSGDYSSKSFDDTMYTHIQISLKSSTYSTYKEFSKDETLEFNSIPTGVYTITATAVDKSSLSHIKNRFKGVLSSFEIKTRSNTPVIDTQFFNGHLNIIINNQLADTKLYAALNSKTHSMDDFEITGQGIVMDIYPSLWDLTIYYLDNKKNVEIFSETLPELLPDETIAFTLNIDENGNVYFSYLTKPYVEGIRNFSAEYAGKKINLTWDFDGAKASFKIYRKKSRDFFWSFINETNSLKYTDSSVTESGEYEYGINTVIDSKESGIVKTNITVSL